MTNHGIKIPAFVPVVLPPWISTGVKFTPVDMHIHGRNIPPVLSAREHTIP